MKLVKRVILFLYQWLIFAPIYCYHHADRIDGNAFAPFWKPVLGVCATEMVVEADLLASPLQDKAGHEHLDPRQSYVFVANHQALSTYF